MAVAADTVNVVGGLGTQAGASSFGFGATKAAWDAGVPSDFIGVNGGPIATDTGITYDHTGNGAGERLFTKTDIGLNVVDGTISYISGTNITTGWYYVTRVDDDNVLAPEIVATGDNADSVMSIGGAMDALQTALDNTTNDATTYNRYIYDNIATETVTGTVKADANAGSASTKVFVIGYNSTLTAEASVILTTTTDITGEAAAVDRALFAIVTVDYYEFRNINFNAGGRDASRAMYAFYAAATGDGQYSTFYNCKFYGAEESGLRARTNNATFVDCEFYLNGTYGYETGGSANVQRFISCSFHDNTSHGLHHRNASGVFANCLVYDNGGNGINLQDVASHVLYLSNTIFGNTSQGLQLDVDDIEFIIINNAFIGNGAYGIHFSTMTIGQIGYFGYNLSGDNTTADYYFGGGAGTDFTNFANGSNVDSAQAADALLKTITDGSEDLTPETSSDLIGAQLDRTA